jgi:hypothetical protein
VQNGKPAAKFGEGYAAPAGYIAVPGVRGEYAHVFGGSSWTVSADAVHEDAPALLMVLDLTDPRLAHLDAELKAIPLFSYINSDCWVERQDYKLNVHNSSVGEYAWQNATAYVQEEEDRIPVPLPETPLRLVEMEFADYALDEDSYWRCTDEFIGGGKFIRVLGKPLWLENAEAVVCGCGKEEEFVACIGYENWDGPYRVLKNQAFFIGEGALYFFYCRNCKLVSVISQST